MNRAPRLCVLIWLRFEAGFGYVHSTEFYALLSFIDAHVISRIIVHFEWSDRKLWEIFQVLYVSVDCIDCYIPELTSFSDAVYLYKLSRTKLQ